MGTFNYETSTFKEIEGRPICGNCGKPADEQNHKDNGQYIWRKSKDGSFRCYKCHDNTKHQKYLASVFVGNTLKFEEVKAATIHISPEANVELRKIKKKFKRHISNAIDHDLLNGSKNVTKLVDEYDQFASINEKEYKRQHNIKYRSKIKKNNIVSQEITNLDEEKIRGNLSTCKMQDLIELAKCEHLPEVWYNWIALAIADKKQTEIIMG